MRLRRPPPTDSIRTQDIKENTIKGIDVRNGTLLAPASSPANSPSETPDRQDRAVHRDRQAKTALMARTALGAQAVGGTAVVDRTRLAAPFTPAGDQTTEAVPLTGNTWTQATGETDQFLGVASVTPEAGCQQMDDSADLQIFVFAKRRNAPAGWDRHVLRLGNARY